MSVSRIVKVSALFILLFTSRINAQDYNTGLGVRIGGIQSGITVKHFISDRNAIEGIIGLGRHSFFITGLYERHQPFPNSAGLSWFYGGGAHVGFFNDHYDYYYYKHNGPHDKIYVDHPHNSIGGDFIIGLEYKFPGAPIDIGLDVKPFIDLVPGFYGYWDGALSVRFTL